MLKIAIFAAFEGYRLKIWNDIENFSAKNPVVTIGIFDGVHLGHKFLLEQLRTAAERENGETVVVTLWPHPRQVLGNAGNLKYLTSLEEKIVLLESMQVDHLVVIPFTKEFSDLESCEFVENILISKIRLKHLIVGFNHKFGKNREGDFQKLQECASNSGFTLEKMSPKCIDGFKVSSSLIRELLNTEDLSRANCFLGYDYFLRGKIVGGNKLGRKIGFPTANVLPDDPHKLIPYDGVYAVHVIYEGNTYGGMLNVGYRPTIETGMPFRTIEVNMFGFSGDIYNKNITIYFRKRIRKEKKFEGIEQLRDQLVADRSEALKILRESRWNFISLLK